MTTIQTDLVACTDTILNEIKQGINRKGVALTYAMAIKSESRGADEPDWKAINAAIIAKWGINGLKRVKSRAWRLIEQS